MSSHSTRHQNRVEQVACSVGYVPIVNKTISPRYQMDFDFGVLHTVDFFGPLGPSLVGRRVVAEHYSGTPEASSVRRALIKALALREDADLPGIGGPHPVLLILCRDAIGDYERLTPVPHPEHRGWKTIDLVDLEIHVLNASELAANAGWGALIFALAPSEQDADERIAELLGDPHIPTILKERIVEAVMQHQIVVPVTEYTSIVERLRAEGRVEGEKRGRIEGRVEGEKQGRKAGHAEGRRGATLRMAEQLGLSMPELREIASIDELEARVMAAIRAGR